LSDQRRTKYDIYADIVDVVSRRGLSSITRMSYGSNLPIDRAKKTLELLVSHGFIKEIDVGGHKQYGATKWGLEYLETYRRMQKFFAALRETVTVNIPKEALSGLTSTGYGALDNMLFGGIPEDYAIVLSSPSCDENDFLVKRFLEVGAENGETTLYVTTNLGKTKNLAEKFKSNFYLLLCNPQADVIAKSLSNVFKCNGIENLNEINIVLAGIFRRLDGESKKPKRACIEIISDILLAHHAVQTRKWLDSLLPGLESRGFTTMAVMNPYMHSPEEVQAVVGLFEGEISLYEKESSGGPEKYLRVKKMLNHRYVEHELPFGREEFQK
jgi:predicted transcriptional regulator/KaiC/GvpD/RAD55 family RecA-like ATPase